MGDPKAFERAEKGQRTMKTTSAVVQSIEARVHVLMVGNRQLTMSVFRQLDLEHAANIQVMGRVRDRDGEWAVGRSKREGPTNGTLVRCQQRPEYYMHPDGEKHEPLTCDECPINGYDVLMVYDPRRFNTFPLLVMAGLR